MRRIGNYAKKSIAPYLAAAAIGVFASGCGGRKSPTSPTPADSGASARYKVEVALEPDFGGTIKHFSYNLCNGDKTTDTGVAVDEVPKGRCIWKFWGPDIEIERRVAAEVNENLSVTIGAIASGTNFPVEHYRKVIPIKEEWNSVMYRYKNYDFVVYAVKHERHGMIERNLDLVTKLIKGATVRYGGVVDDKPPYEKRPIGSIYVESKEMPIVPSDPDIVGTTTQNVEYTGFIKHASIVVSARFDENGNTNEYHDNTISAQLVLRHELARAVAGSRGNDVDESSVFRIWGILKDPSKNDIMVVDLTTKRNPGHKIAYKDGQYIDVDPLKIENLNYIWW